MASTDGRQAARRQNTLTVDVRIEIPRGSRNKYEYDDRRHCFVLDRVLYSSVHYPTDYGFVPRTLAPDGDHLDALVVVHEPTFPGCLIPARPIGLLDMIDEQGPDAKLLAVPVGDPRFQEIHALDDLSPHWLREIENFFATYKYLEGVRTEMRGWLGVEAAMNYLRICQARFAGSEQVRSREP